MQESKPKVTFLSESNQPTKKKLTLSPTPLILFIGFVCIVIILLARPQTNSTVTARPSYTEQVNSQAKVIINGVDQTQAVKKLPSYSLSWLEPRDMHWQHIESFRKENSQYVLQFRDGSERRISPDMLRWLPEDVQKRLSYERGN